MNFETLSKTHFDANAETYSVVEAGYKYLFPASLYAGYRSQVLQYDLVSRWYKQLSDDEKEKVVKISAYG